MTQTMTTVSEQRLQQTAERISSAVFAPFVICLWGDLGAGKTTFCRHFIRALCPQVSEVPSPTFTLVQEYPSSHGEIWHCDLYRLENPGELEELGLIDAFHEKICLIEWADRLGAFLPKNRLDIRLTIAADLTRTIAIQPLGKGAAKIDLSCL
jgi:tRNA threonylcarbamoyladenosine biosynthesis protein TsaE